MKSILHFFGAFILVLTAYTGFTQSVPREMVVMEIGTGTWCYYCPGAAMGADDLLENNCRVAVVENHNGDPFANQYSNARNSYWGISGYPTAVFDGMSAYVGGSNTSSMYTNYLPKYNARIAVPAPIKTEIEITSNGLDYTAVITVTRIGTLVATDFKLHFFITVSHITYNWQGQTHLEHVNVQMVPDQNGTPLSFASGDTQVVTLNFSLDPQWPVEDVEFITFVQDATTTKEVFNGIKRGAIDLTPEFTASSTQIIKNETVSFTNETTGGYIGVPESYQWIFPGGQPGISTDKNPVVTYNEVGVFPVTLIVDRGTQIDTLIKSEYITVNASVGTEPVVGSLSAIYPNPASDRFAVTFQGKFDLQIHDCLGGVVFQKTGIMDTFTFTDDLKPGIYFVKVAGERTGFTRKLIVR